MAYKRIKLNDSIYWIKSDDGCLVVKVGNSVIYLSKEMCKWVAENYEKYTGK